MTTIIQPLRESFDFVRPEHASLHRLITTITTISDSTIPGLTGLGGDVSDPPTCPLAGAEGCGALLGA